MAHLGRGRWEIFQRFEKSRGPRIICECVSDSYVLAGIEVLSIRLFFWIAKLL
jgi:hypothetical protein